MNSMSDLFYSFDKHAGAIQAASSVVIATLTFLLIWVTRRYVRVTHSALEISRGQYTEMMRVEVFLKLRTVPRSLTSSEALIDLANLSSRGIWWEKFRVTTTAAKDNSVGKPVERLVGKIVPAYGVESVAIAELIYRSYLTTGLPDEKPLGRVKVVATYRVGGKSCTEQLESPEMVMMHDSIFLDE